MRDLGWLSARPIAHRGLHDRLRGIIENTPSAVQAAIDGNYAIEVDLQLTADNEAVVFHDSTLDRLTKETGPVLARTAAALKRVDYVDTKDRIITLSELLEQVSGSVPLVIEVKSQWKNVGPLERRVANVLKTYSGHAAVMSFNPRTVEAFRELAPELVRGIVAERFRDKDEWSLSTPWQRFVMRHMLHLFRSRPHFVAYHVKALPSAAPLIARHILRRPLLTWTVRTDADRRRARWFADQIIFEGFRP